MSTVTITHVTGKKQMKQFVRFNYELYKDCPYAVPDMLEATMDDFDTSKNPAFDFCEAEWFLALRDGEIVGRIVAIINSRANEIWNTHVVRFGWIDFIDDREVSGKLIQAVEQWGKERGMDTIIGPLGFTDLDPEGMLFEGFDQLGSMPTIYNYAYYNDHMSALGFEVDATWLERIINIPGGNHEHDANQEKYFRVAKLVGQRYGFHVRKFQSKKELKESGYVKKIFDIINTSYRNLYGYSEMSQKQIDRYADTYLPIIDLDLISIIENKNDEPIAVGICMPDMSYAIQKAKSRLYPFGWYHMAKSLYFNHGKIVDLLLIGTLPEYQGSGCVSLIFADIIVNARRLGYEIAECCPQLETNNKALSLWQSLDNRIHKRRHTWKKTIE